MLVKVLEPSNCLSSLMCKVENEGFCWSLWSYLSKTCLNCLRFMYYILPVHKKTWKIWKKHKVGWTFNSSRTALLGFVNMCKSSQTQTFERTPNWTTLIHSNECGKEATSSVLDRFNSFCAVCMCCTVFSCVPSHLMVLVAILSSYKLLSLGVASTSCWL